MDIEFTLIDIENDFSVCLAARRDAYLCSFNTDDGFSAFLSGYQQRMRDRMKLPQWHYYHVRTDGRIIGQLEFCSESSEPETGYVYLIYLTDAYRGKGLADKLQHFISDELLKAGCKKAMLSVSRTNLRALKYYQKSGWEYLRPNPKHPVTDYYSLMLAK